MPRLTSENKMALYNIASTVLIAGINFITIPIFTRLLDTNGYGIVNIYIAWVQIFTIFVGLKADGSIGSAKANLPEEEQDSYQFSILVLSLITFTVIICLVLFTLQPLSKLLNMQPILTICMVIQSFGAFVISLFSMRYIFKKQPKKNFILSVGLCLCTTILSVLLILFVFTNDDSYMGRVLGLVFPNILIAFGLFTSFTIKKGMNFNTGYWKFCLTLTIPLIFHGLSQLLLAQTGKIGIQQFYGDSIAGVYSIAVVIVTLLNAIYNALNNAFVPFMYDDLAGKTPEIVKQSHFKNYFTSFTFGAGAFMLVAPEILKLMSTEAYWPAIEVLPLLTLGQYFIFMYSFPVNFEFYSMKTRSIAVGTICAALVNITLTVMLLPFYGMMGAAFSTMISYFGLFVFHFCISRFFLGDKNYPAYYYLFGSVAMIATCGICYALVDFAIVRWIAAAVLVTCVGLRIWKTKSIF